LKIPKGKPESVYQKEIDNKMSWRYKGIIRIRISKKNRRIFKTLYCPLFFDIRILITPLVSSRHYVVCSSSIYGFWLPLCIFKTFCCLFLFDIRILVSPLVSSRHYIVCSDNIMSWRYNWVIRIRISKKNRHHNVFKISKGWSGSVNRRRTDNTIVCSSSIYGFWLPLCIFKTLYCLLFFDIRILITPLVSSRHYRWRTNNTMSWRYNWVIRIHISKKNRHHNVFKISKGWSGSVNRGRTDNIMSWRYNWVIRIRISVVYSFLIYGFWFPLWYLQDIILSALLWYTDLITPLVSNLLDFNLYTFCLFVKNVKHSTINLNRSTSIWFYLHVNIKVGYGNIIRGKWHFMHTTTPEQLCIPISKVWRNQSGQQKP
jgi:hypothetical protein